MRSLEDAIAQLLPHGSEYKILNIQSHTTESKSPILYKKSTQPKHSFKVKHYFSIIDSDDIIILGVEVNVYLNVFEEHVDHYVFVSKCDTTGLKRTQFKVKNVVEEYLRALVYIDFRTYGERVVFRSHKTNDVADKEMDGVSTSGDQNPVVNSLISMARKVRRDPEYFTKVISPTKFKRGNLPKHRSVKFPVKRNVILSLFTRYADQYLFPESANNEYKHKIDGSELLSWWINLIDSMTKDNSWLLRVTIPGADDNSIAKYIAGKDQWELGSIFGYDTDNPAIYQIPLFPDDPKGRFLEHLVLENRHATVSGKQFWQELGYRQEFRIGNVVGIIGCKLDNAHENTGDRIAMHPLYMGLKQARKVLTFMKGEDFTVYTDIQSLVRSKLPDLLNSIGKNIYIGLNGSRASDSGGKGPSFGGDNTRGYKAATTTPTNDLTSLVKKKRPAAHESRPNEPINITNLIKRKKKA